VEILKQGNAEELKAAIHGAIALLAFICLGYNALAYLLRPMPRLALGVVIYLALLAWEIAIVAHHLRDVA
jgi:hypothetical protein